MKASERLAHAEGVPQVYPFGARRRRANKLAGRTLTFFVRVRPATDSINAHPDKGARIPRTHVGVRTSFGMIIRGHARCAR
jgi:hypothetical protein